VLQRHARRRGGQPDQVRLKVQARVVDQHRLLRSGQRDHRPPRSRLRRVHRQARGVGEPGTLGPPERQLQRGIAQAARQAGQNRRGGVSFTQGFATTANPTLALPLAGGRGFWMIGILTQTGHYASVAGLRAKNWPDGNQVATPRPAVVHHETDTFITTYTAIDPPRSAGAALTLDGFFGWPLAAVAS